MSSWGGASPLEHTTTPNGEPEAKVERRSRKPDTPLRSPWQPWPCHDDRVADRGGCGVGDLFPLDSAAGRAAAAVDWAATSVGPIATWSPSLLTIVRVLMASRMPMMLMWGPQFVQIYNDANSQILGDKHPDAMGSPAAESFPESWPATGPMLETVRRGGPTIYREDETLLLQRAGYLEETHWRFSWSAVPGRPGEIGGVLAVAEDRTGEILARRRLDLLHRIAAIGLDRQAPDVVARRAVAALGEVRASVPFAAVYLGAPSGGPLALVAAYGARRGSRVLPLSLAVDSQHPYAEACRSGRVGVLAVGRRDRLEPGPVGPRTAEELRIFPLRDSQRRRIGVLVLGLSPYRIPDSRYAEFFALAAEHIASLLGEALQREGTEREVQRLARVDAGKTRFYQDVGHEFRTPLTLIRLALGEMRAGTSGADQRHLDTIERALAQMTLLVEGALAFVESVPLVAAPQAVAVDLEALTRAVVGMFRSAAEAADLSFTLDLDPMDPVSIDPDAWTRIVANLVSNAVKYTRFGGIVVRQHRDDEQWIRLSVEDTGIGIPVAERAQVFDRGHRSTRSVSAISGGLGLGLAIVDELVQALGGTVAIAGDPESGSIFTVRLPIRPEDAAPTATHFPPQRSEAAFVAGLTPADQPGDPGEASSERRTALVIEDDLDLLGYLQELLTRAGWQVHTAVDAQAARECPVPADVVVSDIVLPGTSGLEFVRELRSRGATTPVLLVSARAAVDEVVEGLLSGADDYLSKPFEPAELLARVDVLDRLARRHAAELDAAASRIDGLNEALGSNRRIGFAVGILMAREGLTEEQAFARLREVSNRSNLRVRDLADRVVETGWLDPPRTR